jgi:hypothetical protein
MADVWRADDAMRQKKEVTMTAQIQTTVNAFSLSLLNICLGAMLLSVGCDGTDSAEGNCKDPCLDGSGTKVPDCLDACGGIEGWTCPGSDLKCVYWGTAEIGVCLPGESIDCTSIEKCACYSDYIDGMEDFSWECSEAKECTPYFDKDPTACMSKSEEDCEADEDCIPRKGILAEADGSCIGSKREYAGCSSMEKECKDDTGYAVDPEGNCWEFSSSGCYPDDFRPAQDGECPEFVYCPGR